MNLNEAYFESVLGVKDPAQRDDMLTMAISGSVGRVIHLPAAHFSGHVLC